MVQILPNGRLVKLIRKIFVHNMESAWQALAGIQREDYCNKFCGTKDAYCDSRHGKCICNAGITYASVAFGNNRIPLSSQCHDDKICRKYWCRRADSYCDDGACICHPCRPRHF
ncbi:hypothetical protein R6Q59_002638 [Mikania micrantha]